MGQRARRDIGPPVEAEKPEGLVRESLGFRQQAPPTEEHEVAAALELDGHPDVLDG